MIRCFLKHFGNALIGLVFVAGISTPGAVMLWRTETPEAAATENRVLAARPEWSWDWDAIQQYPSAFSKYFDDAFGLRPVLTRWHHLANLRVFGISPTAVVAVGKDEWLYLDCSVQMYRREFAFTDQHIAHQARLLQERHDWLASRGIKFLVVIVPNKPEVYPEYLPAHSHQLRPESNTDRLEAYVKENCSFELLNLRPALLEAKKTQLAYNPADCHWNDFGAYAGYQAVIDRLSKHFPTMTPLAPEQCTVETRQFTGDLMRMCGFPELTEPRIFMKPAKPRAQGVKNWKYMVGSTNILSVPDERLPKAVIMHDSFMTALTPFLAEHFEETTCRWIYGDFDHQAVVEHQPDVVIQEMVERCVNRLVKNPPEILPQPQSPARPPQKLAEGPRTSTAK